MSMSKPTLSFDLSEKIIVVTGGTGVLLKPTIITLGNFGAHLVLLGRNQTHADDFLDILKKQEVTAEFILTDVTNRSQIQSASERILERYGRVDILINGAGGNQPQATTSQQLPFFDLPENAVRDVFDLNFLGTFFCCQILGKLMAQQKSGNIVNISSMSAIRPLTRIATYSAAKSALTNFTQWLAVHMAQEYSPHIRVNAIAPGFFLTEQNQFLLTQADTGALTPRGKSIINQTPMNRFGDPEDIVGTILWLLSSSSNFVTGIVVPVDGGFSAFSGV
jgi:NAD(P)-dependent dehydrogenase (short-subunit alcohol dehydrogenase family)